MYRKRRISQDVKAAVALTVFSVAAAALDSVATASSGGTAPASPIQAPPAKGVVAASNLTQPGHWCQYPKPKAGRPAAAHGGVAGALFEVEPNDTPAEAQLLPLGVGAGLDRDIDLFGAISPNADVDYFRFAAIQGDVIGMAALGENAPDTVLTISNLDGTLIIENDDHRGQAELYPLASPFIGGTSSYDSALTWVVPADGEYLVKIRSLASASSGTYALAIRSRRPGIESEPAGSTQIIFLDFDGAVLSPQSTFGLGPPIASLSPLSTFLAGWGLTAADESAVIDAIIAVVEENLEDLRLAGINGDLASDGIGGHFDYELRNSRDDPDPFPGLNVSRVIVGGTIDEFGIGTIGLAESIDPGNFETEETAVVLLDLLSAPSPDVDSINSIPRDPSVTIIDAIGLVVGNIVDHEIGHYLGNWHTDNQNGVPCLMDAGGFLQENIAGVGDDGELGTTDDIDPDFIEDQYLPFEDFGVGSERTDVRTAFALATGSECVNQFHHEDFEDGTGGYIIEGGLWQLTTACDANEGGHSTPTALYYGNTGACNYDSGSSNGSVSSPVIDLSGATGPAELSFRYKLETEGHPTVFDCLFVTMQVLGEPGVTLLASNAPNNGVLLDDPSPGWVKVEIDLGDVAGSQIQFTWYFDTGDALDNAFAGFYLDDVTVCANSDCPVPLGTRRPDPPDGAIGQPLDVLLTWEGGLREATVITFDELPLGTRAVGAVIGPVAFGFTSDDATISMEGPGVTDLNDPPNLEGDGQGTLTLDFSVPVFAVSYAFGMNTSEPAADATTLTLFDENGQALATASADAIPSGFFPSEGQNSASTMVAAASATITFAHPTAQRFSLDNLSIFPFFPDPSSGASSGTALPNGGRRIVGPAPMAVATGALLWPKPAANRTMAPQASAPGTDAGVGNVQRSVAPVVNGTALDATTMTDPTGATTGAGACALTFDVFFGEAGGPHVRVCADLTASDTSCNPGPLLHDTTYEWFVVSTSPRGSVTGPTWRFTTNPGCAIASGQPANCAIDARQPYEPDTPWLPLGWTSVTLEMDPDCDAAIFVESDFSISVQNGPAPQITGITATANVVTLQLSDAIPAGQWTCILQQDTGRQVCLGYLPGDVDGNGTSSPADILALIDAINGVAPRPEYATDTNRSGTSGPEDILRVIDLLNGASAFDAWLDQSLEACPN
ncbi:MAG: hypothetical protein ACE5E5_10760 [Phycisphaerae bacterium]